MLDLNRKNVVAAAIAALAMGFLAYQLWVFDTRIFARLIALIVIALLAWLTFLCVRQGRMTLRGLVVIMPIVVAIICIPLREIMLHRRVVAGLQRAGITDFQLASQSRWQRFCETTVSRVAGEWAGLQVRQDLIQMELDLASLDIAELTSVSGRTIQAVKISGDVSSSALAAELIEWLNGCPHLYAVSMDLIGPSDRDLALLARLQKPMFLTLSDVQTADFELELPSASTLSFVDCTFADDRPFRSITAEQLDRVSLTHCQLESSPALLDVIGRTNEVEFMLCDFSPEWTRALLAQTIRDLTLGDVRFPNRFKLPDSPRDRGRSLTLWGANLAPEQVQSMVAFRRPSVLYINFQTEVAPDHFGRILSVDSLRSVRILADWARREHLEAVFQQRTSDNELRLRLLDATISENEEQQLKSQVPASIELGIERISY